MLAAQIYAEILKQALGPHSQPPSTGTAGFTEHAERLADDIYRLCIEFGVAFNTFKGTVLEEVLARRGVSSNPARPPSFLDPFADQIQLLLFALELMREDEAF